MVRFSDMIPPSIKSGFSQLLLGTRSTKRTQRSSFPMIIFPVRILNRFFPSSEYNAINEKSNPGMIKYVSQISYRRHLKGLILVFPRTQRDLSRVFLLVLVLLVLGASLVFS